MNVIVKHDATNVNMWITHFTNYHTLSLVLTSVMVKTVKIFIFWKLKWIRDIHLVIQAKKWSISNVWWIFGEAKKTCRFDLTTMYRIVWLKHSGQFSLPYQICIKHSKCLIICFNNKVGVLYSFQFQNMNICMILTVTEVNTGDTVC